MFKAIWAIVKWVLLAGVTILGMAVILNSEEKTVDALPQCNEKQVRNIVVDAMNKNMLSEGLASVALGKTRVISIESAHETASDEGARQCKGFAKRTGTSHDVEYTIMWEDRNNGLFNVTPYDYGPKAKIEK